MFPHKKDRHSTAGFTLLELLIVIAIIGSLALMGMSNYLTSIKRGRDARRKQDLKFIQQAVEQYYSICKYAYPALATNQGDNLSATITASTPTCDSSYTYTLPTDPYGNPYVCERVGGCTSDGYTICPSSAKVTNRLEMTDCSDKSCCVSNIQ
jgi:prepilin-type N-terminal cleavage/methylation domain-containing protein